MQILDPSLGQIIIQAFQQILYMFYIISLHLLKFIV